MAAILNPLTSTCQKLLYFFFSPAPILPSSLSLTHPLSFCLSHPLFFHSIICPSLCPGKAHPHIAGKGPGSRHPRGKHISTLRANLAEGRTQRGEARRIRTQLSREHGGSLALWSEAAGLYIFLLIRASSKQTAPLYSGTSPSHDKRSETGSLGRAAQLNLKESRIRRAFAISNLHLPFFISQVRKSILSPTTNRGGGVIHHCCCHPRLGR